MKTLIRIVKREEREAAQASLPATTPAKPVSTEMTIKNWIIASRTRREADAVRYLQSLGQLRS